LARPHWSGSLGQQNVDFDKMNIQFANDSLNDIAIAVLRTINSPQTFTIIAKEFKTYNM